MLYRLYWADEDREIRRDTAISLLEFVIDHVTYDDAYRGLAVEALVERGDTYLIPIGTGPSATIQAIAKSVEDLNALQDELEKGWDPYEIEAAINTIRYRLSTLLPSEGEGEDSHAS